MVFTSQHCLIKIPQDYNGDKAQKVIPCAEIVSCNNYIVAIAGCILTSIKFFMGLANKQITKFLL